MRLCMYCDELFDPETDQDDPDCAHDVMHYHSPSYAEYKERETIKLFWREQVKRVIFEAMSIIETANREKGNW